MTAGRMSPIAVGSFIQQAKDVKVFSNSAHPLSMKYILTAKVSDLFFAN